MIHVEAVKPGMLEILRSFMRWPDMSSFCLVGGTSIALRSGYRESDDIDLFSPGNSTCRGSATRSTGTSPTAKLRASRRAACWRSPTESK